MDWKKNPLLSLELITQSTNPPPPHLHYLVFSLKRAFSAHSEVFNPKGGPNPTGNIPADSSNLSVFLRGKIIKICYSKRMKDLLSGLTQEKFGTINKQR